MANEFIARKGIISLDSIQVSGSITATGGITVSGSISSASFATSTATASSADNFFVRQNLTASSALFTGSITAQTLVVQTVTSSIVYSSGSNIFGNLPSNVQQFTGSVTMTGSLVVTTTAPELTVGATGVTLGNVLTDVHQVTGSLRITGSGAHFIQGGCVGIGCVSPGYTLDVNGILNVCTSTGSQIRLLNYGGSSAKIRGTQSTLAIEACGAFTIESGGATERLRINENGVACFACQVCVGGNLIVNGGTIELNCSNTTNTDARINMYTSNNVNGDRATIYGYNLAGTTGGCEITYLAFGYCSTNVQGYINMQTKSGASWCNTMSLRNGLVGIGTTTPGAKLEVNGAIIGTSVGIGGSPLTELYISSGTMRIDGTTPLIYLRGGSSGAKGAITLNHFGYVDFSINAGCSGNYILGITRTPGGTDGILLHCSGDVGIGLTSPVVKLDVNGSVYSRGNLGVANGTQSTNTASAVLYLGNRGYFTSADTGAAQIQAISSSPYWYSGTNLAFFTNPGPDVTATSAVERMRITTNGNINFNSTVYDNTATATARTLYIGSDYRIGGISSTRASKKNIENVSNVNWIYELNPVTFNYRKKDEEGNYTEDIHEDTNYGLIAEDVAVVANFLINYTNKEDGTKEIIGIEYSRLITPLLKAIQEQQCQICTQSIIIDQLKTCLGII